MRRNISTKKGGGNRDRGKQGQSLLTPSDPSLPDEKKSWASSATAKTLRAPFLCLTHNLMVLLEDGLLAGEGGDNGKERARIAARKAGALAKGANYVATLVQRFTVRSVKCIRWLRNFIYREVPWARAVARLRAIYLTFYIEFSRPFLSPKRAI